MKTLLIALAAAVALPTAAHAAAFTNGSFELGADPGPSFSTLLAGDTSITGWTVGGTSIDYIGGYWTASQGVRSIDLSGGSTGSSISQTFDTVAGQAYVVSFDLGGNGDGPPPIKTVDVLATGGVTQGYTAPGSAIPNIAYTPYRYLFTASGASTTLTFTGTDAGPFGAALDNVSVTAVPEPATWAMMILGVGAVGGALRRRRQPVLATA